MADLTKIFHGGFDNGHGYIREPNSIRSAGAITAVIIQSLQNDQLGGIAVSGLDFSLSEYVRRSWRKILKKQIDQCTYLTGKKILFPIDYDICKFCQPGDPGYDKQRNISLLELETTVGDRSLAEKIFLLSVEDIVEETEQSMEALIHNLNSLHSRAGSQTPFSSVNYGMCTTPEGRLVSKSLLKATWNGLGHGETPIFPVQIFQVMPGVNYNPGDPNYDLFKLAMKVSAKRLYPNFNSVGSSFNLPYYKPDDYRTFAATMGCRTRVASNVNGPETFTDRGNFAFATIILPKLAIEAKGDIDAFFKLFDKYIKLCRRYLKFRFELIAKKKAKNFPMSMLQHCYMGSEKLSPEDEIRPALKNASLSIGYLGLAEALVALTGKHHGESEAAQELGLKIIRYLREKTDGFTKTDHLNWSTFATPAESLAGRAAKLLQKQYGKIPGVTDRAYLTNSNHIPVYYPICAAKKIDIEAPYHSICNAG